MRTSDLRYRESEDVLVLYALKNITQGEEICISYVDATMRYSMRRQQLLDQYNFDIELHPPEAEKH